MKRRVVLVDVDTILSGKKLWYDWRQCYEKQGGNKVKLPPLTLQKYMEAAQFSVKSAKGNCAYTGWVYTDSLHLPQYPWRRVVYDEIQDLVQEGSISQKCLLQLTRTAKNVWLLSGTPFPHGNQSVYANHELLGFCRLRLDVMTSKTLPSTHPFERIKRQLYIRSPPAVAQEAVAASSLVTRTTEYVAPLVLEQKFYELQEKTIEGEQQAAAIAAGKATSTGKAKNYFDPCYNVLREMTVHPEASDTFRKVKARGKFRKEYTRSVSTSVQGAARRAVHEAKKELEECKKTDLEELRRVIRYTHHSPNIVFRKINFRQDGDTTTRDGPLFARGFEEVLPYFRRDLAHGRLIAHATRRVMALDRYITVMEQTHNNRREALANLERKQEVLRNRIVTLTDAANEAEKSGGRATANNGPTDELALQHGSKPAALVRQLQKIAKDGEQTIVFSYWHDTLKLVQRTLIKCGIESVFCDGRQTANALSDFTSGKVHVILLSAQSKASGANLQCATHVVLLDPAGQSAEHGSTLEEQAIGRAVRMGQEKSVTVTRFCVVDTLEEKMFQEIDTAHAKALQRASDDKYVIKDSQKVSTKKAPKSIAPQASDEVQVTAELTREQRLQQDFEEAQKKGEVIDLLDSDDEGPVAPAVTSNAEPQPAPVNVKQEPNTITPSKDVSENPAKRSLTHTTSPNSTANAKRLCREVSEMGGSTNSTASVSGDAISPPSDSRAPAAGHEQDQNVEGIRGLLERCNLESYLEQFIAHKLTDVDALYQMADSSDHHRMEGLVDQIGFSAPSHTLRFYKILLEEAQHQGHRVNLGHV
ncbi:MAG: hypothetical protein SGARI_000285 [Bacillariaceae sp.]